MPLVLEMPGTEGIARLGNPPAWSTSSSRHPSGRLCLISPRSTFLCSLVRLSSSPTLVIRVFCVAVACHSSKRVNELPTVKDCSGIATATPSDAYDSASHTKPFPSHSSWQADCSLPLSTRPLAPEPLETRRRWTSTDTRPSRTTGTTDETVVLPIR